MPVFVCTAIIRRGGRALAWAHMTAGVMASSSGSPRATPAPRRKVRRESDRFVITFHLCDERLLRLKNGTLHHFLDQALQARVVAAGPAEDRLDVRPVGEADR